MVYYLIKDSKYIYSILQNGIDDNLFVCSIDLLDKSFEKASKSFVPCVFEISDSDVKNFTNFNLTSNVNCNNVTVMDPKELGIKNSASNIVYQLYKANNENIKSNINKIAKELNKSDNKDLSDYLLLVNKVSFDNNNLKKFAKEFKMKDVDLEDALEHASIMFDEDFSRDDFEYSYDPEYPVSELYIYDDISAWAEWQPGELKDMDEEELKNEVKNFRPKAMDWIETGTCDPIFIIDFNEGVIIGDGRGRVSIAIGLNWDTIPVIFAVKKNKKANSYDRILKLAESIELGNPDIAGKSLADIVLFLMKRIPEQGRAKAVSSMISKIRNINAQEISGKEMGDYSSMGQSLTFIKNVLSGHKEGYVRRVLDAIVRNLS